ncbi:GNAT family N-acetyltransferase [bacterium]|nr:GNAT family N-acetyltransferase [bacterium]
MPRLSGPANVIQGVFPGAQPNVTISAAKILSGRVAPSHKKPPNPSAELAQPNAHQPKAFNLPNLPPSGPGEPLPLDVQTKMESVFGTDFSNVRIHVGPQAASIGALAYTRGSDIHFAPGQYNPYTPHGQTLLGHELTHVLQQRAGRVRNPFGCGVAVVQDPTLEAEADQMGMRAAAFPTPAEAPTSTVQRKAGFQITSHLAGSHARKLSVMTEGKLIGSVEVRLKDADTAELINLRVDPQYRGLGAGKQLLQSARQVGREMGRPHLTLESEDKGNGRLTAWYQRHGFKATGIGSRGYTVLQASTGSPSTMARLGTAAHNRTRAHLFSRALAHSGANKQISPANLKETSLSAYGNQIVLQPMQEQRERESANLSLFEWTFPSKTMEQIATQKRVLFLGAGVLDKPRAYLEANRDCFVLATEYKLPTEMEDDEWQEVLQNMLAIERMGGKVLLDVDVTKPGPWIDKIQPFAPFDKIVFNFPHTGVYAVSKETAGQARGSNSALMVKTFELASRLLKPGGRLVIRESGYPYRPKIMPHGFEHSVGLAALASGKGFGHVKWKAEGPTEVKRTHGTSLRVRKPYKHVFKRLTELTAAEVESPQRLEHFLSRLESELWEKVLVIRNLPQAGLFGPEDLDTEIAENPRDIVSGEFFSTDHLQTAVIVVASAAVAERLIQKWDNKCLPSGGVPLQVSRS